MGWEGVELVTLCARRLRRKRRKAGMNRDRKGGESLSFRGKQARKTR